ncbi:MAG: minor capsid protein [Deltaproteobacteria bacterium]|nr:minor capsid protein [Deltaproteobacteria bacterium]
MTPGQATDRLLRLRARLESMSKTQAEIIFQAIVKVSDRVEERLLRGETWPWKGLMEAEPRLRLQRLRSVEREIKQWSDEAQDELLALLDRRSGTLLGALAALAAAAWADSKGRSTKPGPFSSSDVKSILETSVGGKSLRVWIQRAFSNLADRIRRWMSGIGKGGATEKPSRGLRGEIERFCRQVSKTLARSYVNATFNRVNDKLFERSGVNKVVYRGILDDRTCWECRKQFGRVFDVNDPRRPSIPQHLNCRCFYEPYVEGLTSGEEDYESPTKSQSE